MKMRKWRVEIGFSKFSECPTPHDPLRVCEGCRQFAGTTTVDVRAYTTWGAFGMALDQWGLGDRDIDEFEIVALTLGGDPISPAPATPSPPRASRRKPGSPPARKGSTATKTSGARGRSGTGHRTK